MEWVQDWYDDRYYPSSAVTDPQGPPNGQFRVVRGGSWSYDYRFDGTRGRQTYRFRAKVPPETGYPFATGRSRVVRVRVTGV